MNEGEELFKDLETISKAASEMLVQLAKLVKASDALNELETDSRDKTMRSALRYVGSIAKYAYEELEPFAEALGKEMPERWKEAFETADKYFPSEQPESEMEVSHD
jgi:hypothetical protein